MRRIVFSLVVLATTPGFLVVPAEADKADDEAANAIKQIYDAMLVTAEQQDTYCAKPRTNNTERCNKDFQAVYDKAAQTLGFEVMYLKSRKDGAERTQRYMAAAYDRSHSEMMGMMSDLKAKYYPLPSISQAPAPPTPGQVNSDESGSKARGKR